MTVCAIVQKGALVVALASAVVTFGCSGAPELPANNHDPIARLVWPQLWPEDTSARFDARQSEDPDGSALAYRMSYGDGTETVSRPDGVFDHIFLGAGTYDVRLTVEDEHGATASLDATVVIASTTELPGCNCETPCFAPASCTAIGCFLGATSEEPVDGGETEGPEVPGAISCE